MLSRIQIAWRASRLEKRLSAIAAREDVALSRAGAQAFAALRHAPPTAPISSEIREKLARLRLLADRADAREGALERSLAADRRDFAEASQLARWAVIGRGILDRAAMRDRAKRDARERAAIERELGRLTIGDSNADEVARICSEAIALREELTKLVEPYGGEPLPTWLAVLLRELRTFFGFVWEQLSKRLFLRAPAIAGLLVGWWLGRNFSDSPIATWAHEHIGLDLRGRSEKEWHEMLAFWLPLLAAALCSYIGWAVATRVQRKYAMPEDASGDSPPTAPESAAARDRAGSHPLH